MAIKHDTVVRVWRTKGESVEGPVECTFSELPENEQQYVLMMLAVDPRKSRGGSVVTTHKLHGIGDLQLEVDNPRDMPWVRFYDTPVFGATNEIDAAIAIAIDLLEEE